MAYSCINTSDPEFIDLMNAAGYKNTDVADFLNLQTRVSVWRNNKSIENPSEDYSEAYPTLEDIGIYNKGKIKALEKDLEIFTSKNEEEFRKMYEEFYNLYTSITRSLESENPRFKILINKFIAEEEEKGLDGKTIFSEFRKDLKRILENQETEKDLRHAMFSFVKGISQMSYIAQVIKEDLQSGRFNLKEQDIDDEKNLDAIRTIYEYNNIIKNIESKIKEFEKGYRIDNKKALGLDTKYFTELKSILGEIKKKIEGISLTGVANMLYNSLATANDEITEKFNKQRAEIEEVKAKAFKKGDVARAKAADKKIDEINAKEAKYKVDYNSIVNTFRSTMPDSFLSSFLFVASISSSDPVIAAFKKKVKEFHFISDQESNTVIEKFNSKLRVLCEKLEKFKIDPRKNPESFFKPLTQIVKRKNLNLNNEVKEYEEVFYLHQFESKIYTDKDDKQIAVKIIEREIHDLELELEEKSDETEKNKIKEQIKNKKSDLVKAKKDLSDFLNDYWWQSTNPIIYKRQEIFQDEIGILAKEATDKIFEDIEYEQLKLKSKSDSISPKEKEDILIEIDRLWKEYSLLASERNLDGTEKNEKDLKIAKKVKEYREATREFYDYVTNKKMFNIVKSNFLNDLKIRNIEEGTQEYEEELANWEKENTRVEISKEYYEALEEETNRLNYYLSQVEKDEDVSKKLSEAYEEIRKQLSNLRDENNEIDITYITEEKATVIKALEEKIEYLKQRVEKLSGLTKIEADRLHELNTIIKADKKLSIEDQKEYDALKAKKNKLGVSDDLKEKILESLEAISEMQTKLPTSYYIDNFNALSDDKVIDYDNADDILTDDETLETLFENPLFKTWFLKNHIRVNGFDPNAPKGTSPYRKVWKRIAIWNTTIPSNEDWITKVPNRKYTRRVLKDTYKVDKIEGVTVDNKGQWLPKGYSASGKLLAKDDTYINKDYETLKNSTLELEKIKFEFLNLLVNQHLETQKELSREDRLGLRIPSVEKKKSNFIVNLVKNASVKKIKEAGGFIWERLKEGLHFSSVDMDTGEYNYKKGEYVRTDLGQNEIIDIPIKYIGALKPENISYNLPDSEMLYAKSAILNKNLQTIFPLFKQGLEELEENKPIQNTKTTYSTVKRWVSKTKTYVTGKTAVMSKTNYRADALRAMIETDFKGQSFNNSLGGKNNYFNFITNKLKGLISLSTLTEPVGQFVNWLSGTTSNLLLGIEGVYFTSTQYVIGNGIFFSRFLPNLMKDYGKNDLSPLSLESQIINRFNVEQTNESNIIFGRKGIVNRINVGDILFSGRSGGEKQLMYSALVTMLNNKHVKTKSGAVIKMIDAYELVDGIIQVKDDVILTPQQELHLKLRVQAAMLKAQGNYAKLDKTEAERYAFFGMLFFMKKHLVTLVLKTWGNEGFDITTGVVDAGYYREGPKLLLNFLINFVRSGENKKISTRNERLALAQFTVITALSIISLWGLKWLFLGGGDDDDDKDPLMSYKKIKYRLSYSEAMAYYILYKTISEVESITPFGGLNESMRLWKNPIGVGTTYTSNVVDFIQKLWQYITSSSDDPILFYETNKEQIEDTYFTEKKINVVTLKFLPYPKNLINPQGALVNYAKASELKAK